MKGSESPTRPTPYTKRKCLWKNADSPCAGKKQKKWNDYRESNTIHEKKKNIALQSCRTEVDLNSTPQVGRAWPFDFPSNSNIIVCTQLLLAYRFSAASQRSLSHQRSPPYPAARCMPPIPPQPKQPNRSTMGAGRL